MGNNLSSFVDLSERERKHLICNLCFKIFNNAVISSCGHTFCHECITAHIDRNGNHCPQCFTQFRREDLITRMTKFFVKKTYNTVTNEIIIGNNVFTRNLVVNSMVSDLNIKCNYEFRGCKQVIRFGSIEEHHKRCLYRVCENCGFRGCKCGFTGLTDHSCAKVVLANLCDQKYKAYGK